MSDKPTAISDFEQQKKLEEEQAALLAAEQVKQREKEAFEKARILKEQLEKEQELKRIAAEKEELEAERKRQELLAAQKERLAEFEKEKQRQLEEAKILKEQEDRRREAEAFAKMEAARKQKEHEDELRRQEEERRVQAEIQEREEKLAKQREAMAKFEEDQRLKSMSAEDRANFLALREAKEKIAREKKEAAERAAREQEAAERAALEAATLADRNRMHEIREAEQEARLAAEEARQGNAKAQGSLIAKMQAKSVVMNATDDDLHDHIQTSQLSFESLSKLERRPSLPANVKPKRTESTNDSNEEAIRRIQELNIARGMAVRVEQPEEKPRAVPKELSTPSFIPASVISEATNGLDISLDSDDLSAELQRLREADKKKSPQVFEVVERTVNESDQGKEEESCVRKYIGKPAKLQPLSLDSLVNPAPAVIKRRDSKHAESNLQVHESKNPAVEQVEIFDEKPIRPAKAKGIDDVEIDEVFKPKRKLKIPLESDEDTDRRASKHDNHNEPDNESKGHERRQTRTKEERKVIQRKPPMNFDIDTPVTPQKKFSILDNDQEQFAVHAPPKPANPPPRRRVQTNINETKINNLHDDEEYQPPTELYPCSICNRTFSQEDRLEKHMIACQKSQKVRKVFDATKARVKGTELEKYHANPQLKKAADAPKKKSNWREKHQEFLKIVRKEAPDSPGGGATANPDYVLCEYCDRRFNEIAAERHIPICRESKRRAELRVGATKNGAASEERKKRMAYDPRKSPKK